MCTKMGFYLNSLTGDNQSEMRPPFIMAHPIIVSLQLNNNIPHEFVSFLFDNFPTLLTDRHNHLNQWLEKQEKQ